MVKLSLKFGSKETTDKKEINRRSVLRAALQSRKTRLEVPFFLLRKEKREKRKEKREKIKIKEREDKERQKKREIMIRKMKKKFVTNFHFFKLISYLN